MSKKKKCSFNGGMDCRYRSCPFKNDKFYHKLGIWLSCEPYQYSVGEDDLIELADMYLCLYDMEDLLRKFYITEKVDSHTCVKIHECFSRYVDRFIKSGDYGKG